MLREVNFNLSLPDLIVKEIIIVCHHNVCYSRYTRTPMIGSSGANVSKESHGSSASAYTRAFSRLANVIKQSIMIINCPNDGNVASMPGLCHRYLLLLEGREGGGVLHCSGL